MATELFRNLDREVGTLTSSIQSKLTQLPSTIGEQRKIAARGIQRDIDNAKDLVQQMDLELRHQPQSNRSSFEAQVRARSQELDTAARQLSQLSYGYGAVDRGGSSVGLVGPDPSRQRLLLAQEKLDRTQERMTNSERLANETEALGTSILNDLHEQRDVILRAGDRLNETEANLKRGDRTLGRMRLRAAVMRIIWWIVLFVVVAIIVLILYLQLT